jgi:hypothetical protein
VGHARILSTGRGQPEVERALDLHDLTRINRTLTLTSIDVWVSIISTDIDEESCDGKSFATR